MASNNDDIAKILNKISSDKESPEKKSERGEIEFEIGSRPKEAIKIKEEPAPTFEIEEASEEEAPAVNIFDLAEKEESEPQNEGVYRFRATYIPRFTDMDAPKENEAVSISLKEEKIDVTSLDPTAEIDKDESVDAISVKLDASGELIDESSHVFKFDDPEEEAEPMPIQIEEPQEESAPPVAVEEKEPEPMPVPEHASVVEVKAELAPDPEKNEKYVPTEVSRVENITNVGDVILEDGNKKEFKHIEKSDDVKDKLLDTLLSIKVRFFAALFLTILVGVFENLSLFGVDVVGVLKLDAVPSALAIIDIQLGLCLFLLSLPEFFSALKALSSGRFVSDIFLLPAFAVYLIYTGTVIVRSLSGKCVLLGFIYSIFVLSAIAASYLKKCADYTAFKMISSPDEKMIIDSKHTRLLERENIALDGVVEEYKSRTARVFRTNFVADFFNRTSRSAECAKHLLLLLVLPLGISVVIAVVAFFIYGNSYMTALTAFSVVYLFTIPAFSVLTHKLPYYYANAEAASIGGAAIGESSLHEYSEIDVICLEDTDVFGAEDVNIQRIMLYGNNENLTKALRQMSALFMNVGGPLDVIFSNSLDKKCDPANGVLIKENGISAELDGKKIMAGSYEYMLSEGVSIPTDTDDVGAAFGSTKTMYAAENGRVYAKFLIRYRFSEEFTMLLPMLREENIVPLIYTRDPNVSPELFKTLTSGTNDIRILKKNTLPNTSFAPAKISAGMVFDGEKENLVNLLLIAKRYVRLNATAKLSEISSMIAALAIGALLALGDMISPITVPMLALWQVGWCFALHILGKKSFKSPKDSKNNAK